MRFANGKAITSRLGGFAVRLAHDREGNTLMIVAFSLIPILAMIGGGIDMGRGYLSQSRLQQACDAGVLAARKKLGRDIVTSTTPGAAVKTEGDKLFNANFKTGSYGTGTRTFAMTIGGDYSINGAATVKVPTTLMFLFGYKELNIAVTCQAKLNFSNTDVMMVLDTTGSMNETNAGDSKTRIQVLRDVVKNFHGRLEAAKTPGTRMRYGFVPYSTNVNVGFLLKSAWLVDSWNYEGRATHDTGTTFDQPQVQQNWVYESGTHAYGTRYRSATCPGGYPTWTEIGYWVDPDGTKNWRYVVNGTGYNCYSEADGGYTVEPYTYTDYTYVYKEKDMGVKKVKNFDWEYKSVTLDVSGFKGANPDAPPKGGKMMVDMAGYPEKVEKMDAWMNGCIEERKTYEITDYANVDLTRALDLDIDLVPTNNPDTQWKPQLPAISWLRGITWGNWGSWPWSVSPIYFDGDYIHSGWGGHAACPVAARKLAEMNATDVANYVDGLVAEGATYHDIGMIWGGRLLSPTGIFASDNADVGGSVTNRHLIFLTDGLTASNQMSYSSYGIEGLTRRRWSPSSAISLTKTIENRFAVACNEVKKKNITVWVIGFGTSLNPVLTDCAGPGRYFEAKDATTLDTTFSKIAEAMGDLRISK
ncbi:TadE/TadG family type IV pilus assembly protein [Novosphingobium sp. TH158]|uniref:TadE/TadG family type IV pilus assembly protein n=1 Tax=Novosphingobium sp. TH158 TaxID=2067455 RepID=UPI000C7A6245|nr:TadE/TadG family type IV pilus assembly protein [Novosphingobium sp. TH158]PLK25839.1 hypothetical protein C0V78_02240 [Novosphingobium sp. TH158]